MIRLILVVLAVVLYLIFSIPVLSYLKNLEKKDPKAAAKKSLDLVRWILGIVRDLAGITYEVRGLEHIPSDRAVLYVETTEAILIFCLPACAPHVRQAMLQK